MREPLAVLRYTAEAMEEILNRILRLLALAVTLSLFATIAASADTLDNETFTISDIVGGAAAGNTYTGSFTWDTTTNTLTAFSTNFPTLTGVTATDLPSVSFTDPNLSVFYAPSGGGTDGNPDAFAFFFSGPPRRYSRTDTRSIRTASLGTTGQG